MDRPAVEYLSTAQVGAICGVSVRTVRRWCRGGLVGAEREGMRGQRRIPSSKVEDALEQGAIGQLWGNRVTHQRIAAIDAAPEIQRLLEQRKNEGSGPTMPPSEAGH